MRQVGQSQVGEDGLGHVHDDVAGVVPRREYTQLGLALGHHGPFEETDPGMATARIGQDAKRIARGSWSWCRAGEIELANGGADLLEGQTGGGTHFIRGELVVDDHVLQPGSQVCVGGGSAEVGESNG